LLKIKSLTKLGGRSLQNAVKHQLKFLLSTSTQKLYNWYGKKGKKPFGSMTLAAVVTSKAVLTVFVVTHIICIRLCSFVTAPYISSVLLLDVTALSLPTVRSASLAL